MCCRTYCGMTIDGSSVKPRLDQVVEQARQVDLRDVDQEVGVLGCPLAPSH